MKISIFTSTYNVNSNIDGIGLRLWELAQVLSKFFQVKIITNEPSDFSHPNIEFELFTEENWMDVIDSSDAVVFTDLPDSRVMLYAYEKNKKIITENAIPIEHLDYSHIKISANPDKLYNEILGAFQLQVLLSSHFIARSSIEKGTLLASLGMMNRINYQTYTDERLSKLMSYIPIGFNSFSDLHAKQSNPTKHNFDFLWNGGVWDSYDAASVSEAVGKLKKLNLSTTVGFMYKPPNNQYLKEVNRLVESIELLENSENIVFLDKVSHYDRDPILKGTKALICIGRDSIENYTCHRLRLRDVLLYSKPIIIDSFGASGSLVKELGIGITVSNEEELTFAMKEILENNLLYDKLVSNINKIRSNFLIDNNIENLISFIKSNDHIEEIDLDVKIQEFLNKHTYLMDKPYYPI